MLNSKENSISYGTRLSSRYQYGQSGSWFDAIRAISAAALPPSALIAIALSIGLFGLARTGPLWSDAPRYANGAAMIHDWLISKDLLNPYRFAIANYAKYPAFSIPYHPPAFPGMLGVVFLFTGTSYFAARTFVAICLGVSACEFYAIQRHLGVGRTAGFFSSLLFLTTPQVAHWGRDTMSEVPSLAVFLLATYIFLKWLNLGRPVLCWAAFGIALFAFLCRVTTSGLLPGWFLFALWTGRGRRLKSSHAATAAILYVVLAAGYLRFSSGFSRFEVAADGKSEIFSWDPISYFSYCIPQVAKWGTSLPCLGGVVYLAAFNRRSPIARFWLSWLSSYIIFKLCIPTSFEIRHFFAALPAFAGLAPCLFGERSAWHFPLAYRFGQVFIALGLIVNLSYIIMLPRGIVGYATIAATLAAQESPGNVLLVCPYDQELMLRYREKNPGLDRTLMRGDRTLAIRLPGYANVPTRVLATNPEDVLDVIRRGRVRYMVTVDTPDPSRDDRTEEMALAHRTAISRSGDFTLVTRDRLSVQLEANAKLYNLYFWMYNKHLPGGSSELPVVIPTAGFTTGPADGGVR
jgi:4-amino-4-deoxy-L-arabinose transferase-like glycosyltransferase